LSSQFALVDLPVVHKVGSSHISCKSSSRRRFSTSTY